MTDVLEPEWQDYRKACGEVDLFRYHSAFNSGADMDERLYVAESLASALQTALRASELLVAAAEDQQHIDAGWLAQLREHHEELIDYADRTQVLIGETEQKLRRPR